MLWLEKKVPPLILAILAAVGMWMTSLALPVFEAPSWFRVAAALFFLALGGLVCIAGVVEFRRLRTTVDPRTPESTSSLVTSGIYSITRNPMYVGFSLFLVAWGFYLSSPWSLVFVAAFVVYLNRFQIQPEERALIEIFGQEFRDYQARVRRWI